MFNNKRRSIYLTLLGLLALLALPAIVHAQAADEVILRIIQVDTQSSAINGALGGQVTMQVTAEGTSNMAGIQFDIEYDNAVLLVQPENIEQGTVPSGFFMQVNPNGERGAITFAIAGASPLGVASIEVATITFDLIGEDSTASTIAFTGELAGDASAPPKRLTVTKHDGRIGIGNALPPPAPDPNAPQDSPPSAAPTPPRNAPTPSLPQATATPESSGGLCSAPPPGPPLTAGLANGLLLILPVAALAFRRRKDVRFGVRGDGNTDERDPLDPSP